jgi:hypothetical protein
MIKRMSTNLVFPPAAVSDTPGLSTVVTATLRRRHRGGDFVGVTVVATSSPSKRSHKPSRWSSDRFKPIRSGPALSTATCGAFLDPPAREELRRKARQALPVQRERTIEDTGHAAVRGQTIVAGEGVFPMTNPYVTGAALEVTGGEQFVDALE